MGYNSPSESGGPSLVGVVYLGLCQEWSDRAKRLSPKVRHVEIRLSEGLRELPAELKRESTGGQQADSSDPNVPAETVLAPVVRPSLRELRAMPRDQRQVILAAAAKLAEEDYRCDKDLVGFEAFSEEELDDAEPDACER